MDPLLLLVYPSQGGFHILNQFIHPTGLLTSILRVQGLGAQGPELPRRESFFDNLPDFCVLTKKRKLQRKPNF